MEDGYVAIPNFDESSVEKSSVDEARGDSPLKQNEGIYEIFDNDKQQLMVNQQSTV